MLSKLKVYRGPDHPHQAQRPQPLALDHTRSRGPRPLDRVHEGPVVPSYRSTPESGAAPADPQVPEVGAIQELGVSARLEASLRNVGVESIGELVTYTHDDVLSFAGVGPKSFDELVAALAQRGLSLRANND